MTSLKPSRCTPDDLSTLSTDPQRPALLIALSHGFHVRNIVFSALYAHLAEHFRIVLLMPPGSEVPREDMCLLRGATVISSVILQHRFEKVMLFLRKNVFAGRERTQTFNLINEIEGLRHPWVYRVAFACNAVLGRIPAVGRAWQRLESLIIPGYEFDALLERERPCIVLSANYGTEAMEVRLLRSSHRHGIPTVAIVPSWDNLSSKGIIGENPRHLIVWNAVMRDEAQRLYGFAQEAVHICGGLQFDSYAGSEFDERRDEIFDRLGVDIRRPYVVLGTITPRYFPKNVEVLDILIENAEKGCLPSDLQIVVRLHPQVVDDPHFGDNLDQYRERAARWQRVKLSIPRVMKWGTLRPPQRDDSIELAVLLRYAAAAVMPASTLAIDACALGCPVIGIGFDGLELKPYSQSVRRTFDFTHYRRIVQEGGLRIAESAEEMIETIVLYMQDRQLDADGRMRIIDSHLYKLDGLAWERVAQVVSEAHLKVVP
jgi:hypothetical protein